MAVAPPARPHRVAVVVVPPVAVFEMAVACEAFGMDRTAMGVPKSEVRVCAVEPGELATNVGLTVGAPYGLEALRWADTIVVPGWPSTYDLSVPPPDALLDALRRAHRRGARLASFCSGAFLLAATGLLDGQRATTHWMYTERFADAFPAIDVDPDVLYVGSDDGRIWTSAGTASAIDLCLHLIRLDHGAAIANTVARRMVVPPHRSGGQAQFVGAPVPRCDDDALAPTLDWALRHLDEPLTVEQLARRAQMSPRTFARRFRDVTGTTPLQWLLSQRVLHAQRLLEETDLPVELVAERSGFGSAAALRQHFGRLVGTSPIGYRLTFSRSA